MASIVPAQARIDDTGTRKGRGVFAARAFAAGEVVEECPVVPFEVESIDALPPELRRVVFDWGYLCGQRGPQAIALGYGSLYNHANPANLRYEAVAAAVCLRFVAVRAIARDEELTVNYNAHGGGAEWADDAWFERMGVEPLDPA